VAEQTIGFIGLGNLGLPMVANLVERSWRVLVHDLDQQRVRTACKAGATAAEDLRTLATAQFLCFAVPDGSAVSEILLDQGLLDLLSPGTAVIVNSTVLPQTAASLAQECASRRIAFLDAPVSGGAARARSGELTVMVGATAADLERGRQVLKAQASEIVHVGEAGAGAVVKLANQLMLFSALAGAYEAMSLAQAYGVSEDQVLTAVGTGTGSSWASENWGFYDKLSAEYDEAGVPAEHRPWSKDLTEVVRAAADKNLPAPLAALVAGVLPPAVRRHADQVSGSSTIAGER
jgi:3-hydroxyisobutyrate dehydrogenase